MEHINFCQSGDDQNKELLLSILKELTMKVTVPFAEWVPSDIS